MKQEYRKTKWQDNKTPVNAANLNKIEDAIEDLYKHSISPSQIVEGRGVNVKATQEGNLEIGVDKNIMSSRNIHRMEYVIEDKVKAQAEGCPCCMDEDGRDIMTIRGVLFLVLDRYTKKLKYVVLNGIKIFEVAEKDEME